MSSYDWDVLSDVFDSIAILTTHSNSSCRACIFFWKSTIRGIPESWPNYLTGLRLHCVLVMTEQRSRGLVFIDRQLKHHLIIHWATHSSFYASPLCWSDYIFQSSSSFQGDPASTWQWLNLRGSHDTVLAPHAFPRTSEMQPQRLKLIGCAVVTKTKDREREKHVLDNC